MIDQQGLATLPPLVYEWAKQQEELILKHGAPLGARQIEDAKLAGVQEPARVRLLVVDRIPLPENAELALAARRAQVLTEASRAIAIGYGIIIRADRWPDRELILHQLVHVAQCERAGGLETFVTEYLNDRTTCADFSVGSLEEEARAMAREICASELAAK
jgi:hypothetical protein